MAPLWGILEAADQYSKLVFHDIKYHKNGEIADISFHLIIRQEFENTYSIIVKDFAVKGS